VHVLFRAKSVDSRHFQESSMQPDSSDPVSVDSHATVMDDQYTHLSAFAVNGRDGNIRWHHVVGDFEKSRAKVLNIININFLKLLYFIEISTVFLVLCYNLN